jgi:uncharacterized LabA/DUF88 family protein
MDRSALFIDAGYLLAAGGNLTVRTPKRAELEVKVGALANALMKFVEAQSLLPLLRAYWYDGRRGAALTPEHTAVKDVPFLKLRLGRTTSAGAQKGVDSLIFRDLTTLARERAICSAYLLAGDGDMVEAVSMAQDLGVQVILVTVIPTGNSNVSRDLIDEVDSEIALEREFLLPHFARKGDLPAGH